MEDLSVSEIWAALGVAAVWLLKETAKMWLRRVEQGKLRLGKRLWNVGRVRKAGKWKQRQRRNGVVDKVVDNLWKNGG